MIHGRAWRCPLLLTWALLSVTTSAWADGCNMDLSVGHWLKSFDTERAKQKPILDRLAGCLPTDAEARMQVDYLATRSLEAAEMLEPDARNAFVEFNVQVLLINARAGDPSSQHNYAVVHNAEPGSLVSQVIPQDQKAFVYWTRMAAAQGEPRAVFNLAARMGRPNPPGGIEYDPALAYTLLALLKDTYEGDPAFPEDMMAFVLDELMRLADVIDTGERDDAARALKKFDFAMLGPQGRD